MQGAKKRSILVAALVSVAFIILGGVPNVALTNMKTSPARAGARIPNIAVTTVVARKQTYRERLIGYGRARPLTVSEVAANVAGDVVWRSPRLEPGNFVEADTELVRIDDRDLKTAVATATAQLAQAKFMLLRDELSLRKLGELKDIAEKELETSKRSHQRREELRQTGSVTGEDFDASLLQLAQKQRALLELEQQEELAQPEIERAQAEVTAAQSALEQAQTNLDRAVVRAPYSGFIDERMVHLGARVAVGTPLLRMVDTSQIEVPIALPASQYAAVKPGSPAAVRLGEDGPLVWQGEVARVSRMIDDEDRTFFVYLDIPGSAQEPVVPAGAFVVAEIEATEHTDVIVVPRTALVGNQLFVTDEEQAEGVSIIQGRRAGVRRLLTDVALLDGGVEPGERIVVTNVEKVAHGSRVVVIDRPEAEPDDE